VEDIKLNGSNQRKDLFNRVSLNYSQDDNSGQGDEISTGEGNHIIRLAFNHRQFQKKKPGSSPMILAIFIE